MSKFDMIKRQMIEYDEDWRKWVNEIPAIHFKSEWAVKIIPPFNGAMARFSVSYNDRGVSVYFDPFARLGLMYDDEGNPKPYYELYPFQCGIKRYTLDEIEELEKDIADVLEGKV